LSMGLWMLLLVAPLQALIGDYHGLNTLEHQPAKIAAIEGHWEPTGADGAPLLLFGWPDMAREQTRYALPVPHLGSLILTHSWNGKVPALKQFAPADRPNASIVFWSFRVMVALGLLMIALGLWSAWLRWRGRLWSARAFLRCAVLMGPAGLVAIIAGWLTTEVGRQPWVVYGVLRTADAVSPHSVAELGFTLVLFVVVYSAVFGTGIAYMLRLLRAGPHGEHGADGGPGRKRQPMRPLSAVGQRDTHTAIVGEEH
jgi:cytochrome bd ubiquinol oxidase subunit I